MTSPTNVQPSEATDDLLCQIAEHSKAWPAKGPHSSGLFESLALLIAKANNAIQADYERHRQAAGANEQNIKKHKTEA